MVKFRICLAIAVLALGLSGCMATGEEALEKMTPEQRQFVKRTLSRFNARSTEADISRVLGPPVRGSGTLRPSWGWPRGTDENRVEAYFVGGKLVKIRFMSMSPLLGYDVNYTSESRQ